MRKGQNVYKRKDGRWEARIPIGKLNGKMQYKSLYASTYRQALQRKRDFEHKNNKVPSEPVHVTTYRDIATAWMRENSGSWKQSTYATYQNYLDSYILPGWGEKAISDINQQEYLQLMDNLKSILSASSISTVNTILRASLEQYPAVFNVPRKRRKEVIQSQIDILTKEEMQLLVDSCIADYNNTTLGILIAVFSGVRLGELCALKWEDIDMKAGVIHVRHTLQRIQLADEEKTAGEKTKLIFDSPKNKQPRAIPIHPNIRHKLDSGSQVHRGTDYILSGNAKPVEPRTYIYRFKKFCKDLNLRAFKFHTLRHTFASRCVESGMDVKVLSIILGHSSIHITLDRYVHPTMDYMKAQIGTLCYFPSE